MSNVVGSGSIPDGGGAGCGGEGSSGGSHLLLQVGPVAFGTKVKEEDYVNTTPSIFTTHFCKTKHSMMRHLESPFCHSKEVVNAEILFVYVMYI